MYVYLHWPDVHCASAYDVVSHPGYVKVAAIVRNQHRRAACGVLRNPCQQLPRDLPVVAHTEPMT